MKKIKIQLSENSTQNPSEPFRKNKNRINKEEKNKNKEENNDKETDNK